MAPESSPLQAPVKTAVENYLTSRYAPDLEAERDRGARNDKIMIERE